MTKVFTESKELYEYLLAAPDGPVLEAWFGDGTFSTLTKTGLYYSWNSRKRGFHLSRFITQNWIVYHREKTFRTPIMIDQTEIWE